MSSNRSQRAQRGPSGPLFFVLAFLLLSTTSAIAAESILSWIKSPEAYFVTIEELEQWNKQVASPQDAQKFIDEYWQKRGEQFKKDVRTRIEFADTQFGLAKVPGALTAMGRVWMILGTPNEQKTMRTDTTGAAMEGSPLTGRLQDNSVERGARVTYRWIYRKDRLPVELGMSELIVDFNTDTSRGFQHIENPGLVEPYLRRAAAHVSDKYASGMKSRNEQMATASKAGSRPAATSDPLWQATPSLGGASFTGESYISANEQPFYAVSFYIPKSADAFARWKSVLLVGLIGAPDGTQLTSVREPLPLHEYGVSGDRYIDRAFPLAPGKYKAAFAVFTPEGSTMLANHVVEFEVPRPSDRRISTLLATSAIETLEKQDLYDPFTFVAMKYAVKGDRTFTSAEKVGFFAVIENPAGEPEPLLTMSMTIYRDGKTLHKTPPNPAALTRTGPHSWLIGPLFEAGTFKPGRYAIELRIRDLKDPKEGDAFTKGMSARTEFEIVQ